MESATSIDKETTKEDVKRTRGPNKVDVLELEVKELRNELEFTRRLIMGIANYTGTNSLMLRMGIKQEDLHELSQKEIRGKK